MQSQNYAPGKVLRLINNVRLFVYSLAYNITKDSENIIFKNVKLSYRNLISVILLNTVVKQPSNENKRKREYFYVSECS